MARIIKNIREITPRTGSGYPHPFAEACKNRKKYRLGNAAGLNNFGVNFVELEPGAASSQRHWHRVQDEFIWVLEGELTLITDAGESLLKPGMSAGFPAGKEDGHQIINKSAKTASYLEIGDRLPGDSGEYPDIDMKFEFDADNAAHFLHKNGEPY